MYDLGEGEPRDVGGWPRELEYPQEALKSTFLMISSKRSDFICKKGWRERAPVPSLYPPLCAHVHVCVCVLMYASACACVYACVLCVRARVGV